MSTCSRAIFVRFTKNRKSRTLPLTNRAVQLLTNLRQDARPDELIFDPKRPWTRRGWTTSRSMTCAVLSRQG
jgi:integrase